MIHDAGGASIPTSPFAGDDGTADPDFARILRAWVDHAVTADELVAAVRDHRLLVPVVAVLDEASESGIEGVAVEKDSHMAVPLMVRPDGQRGLLAFTCTDAVIRWDPAARPIPVRGADAAAAALQEAADALVIDVAGPVRVVLEGDLLTAAAQGQ